MLIDFNSTVNDYSDIKSEADICIIGTGIGGGILASELSANTNKEIIVVEAGGLDGSNIKNVDKENIGLPFKLSTTTSIQLGGTSNLWHGILAPLDSIDFKKRDWIPHSGWPISKEDLSPYYRKAAKAFSVKTYDFFFQEHLSQNLKDQLTKMSFDRSILENKLFQQPLPALRTKKNIYQISKLSHVFHCYINTPALKLVMKDGSKVVEKLIIGLKNGKTKEIKAKQFIVCGGALETPRLLLNSNFENRNIGKFLMDHPMGILAQVSFNNPHKAHIYSDMKYAPKNKIKSGLTFNESVQKENKLPNHNFYMRPSFVKGIHNESEKVKLALLTFLSGKINPKDIIKAMTNFNVVLQILAYKFTLNFSYKYSDLYFITEQLPNPESEVSLSEKKDSWGYAMSKVNWQLTKQDLESMASSYRILSKQALSTNDYVFTHKFEDLDWEEVFTSAAHHVGTTRMAETEKTGVVDKNLRVFGTENLYICDGSVFPTSGNVNSGFTIGALACRLSNHLKTTKSSE